MKVKRLRNLAIEILGTMNAMNRVQIIWNKYFILRQCFLHINFLVLRKAKIIKLRSRKWRFRTKQIQSSENLFQKWFPQKKVIFLSNLQTLSSNHPSRQSNFQLPRTPTPSSSTSTTPLVCKQASYKKAIKNF